MPGGGFIFPKAFRIAGLQGDPVFFEGDEKTSPGNEIDLFSLTVAAGTTLYLQQILGSCSQPGVLLVYADTLLVGSARSEAGKPDMYFSWFPGRPINAGVNIRVAFCAQSWTDSVDVEAYLMSTEKT